MDALGTDMDEALHAAPDGELVARYLRGRSGEAFRILVDRHAGMVHAACVRGLGPRAAMADDAAQAVFLVLARKAGLIRNPDAVGGWLFHVARTVVSNLLREEEYRRRREEAAARPERSGGVDQRERMWGMALPYLDEGIASLPGAQRDAVVLHFLEGLPQEEAARRLRCAQSTLHERISTALAGLRRFFARKGVVLPAVALAAGLSGMAAPAASAAVVTACAAAGAGGAAGVSLSGGATALAQGALKALFVAKVKVAVALAVCAAAAAGGAGIAMSAFTSGGPPPATAPAGGETAGVREPAMPLPAEGGAVYNLKVLSDKAPDLTDLKAFCHSATSRWETNDEKAAALAYWFARLGNQSGPPADWMPVEPILHFNTSMQAQCAFWTGLYDAVAEGGMGWVGRHYEVGDHTVPELEYDGKRHYLDNTYKFFPTACDGKTIIGITDMDEEAGPCPKGPRCRYHWLLYHTSQAACEDRDGYVRDKEGNDSSPMRAWLVGSWLRREAAGRAYFAEVLDDAWVRKCWKQEVTESCHSVYRMAMTLRENESYTRHWKPLGDTADYYYPNSGGKDPDSGLRDRGRGNGVSVFEPDLSKEAGIESAANLQRGRPALHPGTAGAEAVAVFKVQTANVVCGSVIEAEVVRRSAGDSVVIEASCTAGKSWFPVWADEGTGQVKLERNISDALRGTFAGKDLRVLLNYLVRVRMTAKVKATDAGLEKIRIKTLTALNRQSLPLLGLGRNFITVDYDKAAQHRTLELRPVLKAGLVERYAVEQSGMASQKEQGSWSATLYSAERGAEGHVTFELEAPKPIFRARMGGSIWIGSGDAAKNYVRYDQRTWNGAWSGWQQVGLFSWDTRDTPHARRNQTKYVETKIAAAGVTKVQFRFAFCSASGGGGGAGANLLRMEVDYPAADAAFKPVEVTYNWTEFHDPAAGKEEGQGVERSHTERAAKLPHTYWINTGGDIAPRMNWIRVNLEGSSPEPVKPGYSDGKDAGDRYEIPRLKYAWGELLSLKKPYTAAPSPAKDGHAAAGDEQELTDGVVKEPQAEGPWPEKCVAHWSKPGGPVRITVDLGEARKVGGVRVDAFYTAPSVRFPKSVAVETSTDGVKFTLAGRDRYRSATYAHNGWPANWPLYSRHDSPRFGEFPDYGLYANYIFIPFEKAVEARHVRFVVEPQDGAGLMLSEVNVWDRLEATPWTPRLAHEAPAKAKTPSR